MKDNQKIMINLGLTGLALIIAPVIFLINHQQPFPWLDLTSPIAQMLYWLTTTGISPYGIITVTIFLVLSLKYVPKPIWIRLACTVIISLIISSTSNHQVKAYFAEPRPNVVFLAKQVNSQLDLDTFYQQERVVRQNIMIKTLQQYQVPENTSVLKTSPTLLISMKIQKHWIHEVGYSLPSGHSIFAATLVLTASYYLLLAGATGLNIMLGLWGVLMGLSRMLLGMHWPQDVIASTCLAVFISGFTVFLVEQIYKRIHIPK